MTESTPDAGEHEGGFPSKCCQLQGRRGKRSGLVGSLRPASLCPFGDSQAGLRSPAETLPSRPVVSSNCTF
jgi:hypothetical protein